MCNYIGVLGYVYFFLERWVPDGEDRGGGVRKSNGCFLVRCLVLFACTNFFFFFTSTLLGTL